MAKEGRPTKYREHFVEVVEAYLKTVGREQTKLPKRTDIALLLGVDEDTLNNWAKLHPEFLGTLTRVDLTQKGQLMDDGMYGGKEVNPQMSKFLLSANHGMKETDRHEHTGENGDSISIKLVSPRNDEE